MSYASNYNLNSRLSALESQINGGGVPTSSNLQDVLDNGNSATDDILITDGATNVTTIAPTSITLTDGTTTNTINKNGYTTRNSVQNSTHFLNFSDASATGTGAIQKTAGIECNPSTKTLTVTDGTTNNTTNISPTAIRVYGDINGPLLNLRYEVTGVGLSTKAAIRDAGLLITSGSSIFLQSGAPITFTGTTSGGAIGYINGTAGVPIQFNGATKIATTNTGVTVTGTTDTTTINNASGVAVQFNGATQISTSSLGVVVPNNIMLNVPTTSANGVNAFYFTSNYLSPPLLATSDDIGRIVTGTTLTTFTTYITPIYLNSGTVVSNICMWVANVATTITGIFNEAGTVLAQTAVGGFVPTAGFNRMPMATPFTITTSGIYYIAVSPRTTPVPNQPYGVISLGPACNIGYSSGIKGLRAGNSSSYCPSVQTSFSGTLTVSPNATFNIWVAVA